MTKPSLRIALLIYPALIGCGQSEVTIAPTPDLTGSYDEVRDLIDSRRKIVLSDPDSPVSWGRYGMALDAHELNAEATECYALANKLSPEDHKWAHLLALKCRHSELRRADRVLSRLELTGMNLATRLLWWDVKRDRLEDVRFLYDAMSAEEKAHPAVQLRYIEYLIEQGHREQAVAELNQVRGSYIEIDRLKIRLGVKEDNTDRSTESQRASVNSTLRDPYRQSVQDSRRDPLWRAKVAYENALQGDTLAAITLKRLATKYPDVTDNQLRLVALLQFQSDEEAAIQVLKDLLRKQPGKSRLIAALAALQIKQQAWKEAQQTLSQLVTITPNSAAAWADMGFVLEQRGKLLDSIEAYQKALILDPSDEDLRGRISSISTISENAE